MAEKEEVTKDTPSADWFVRGALARIGDTLDKFTGRKWTPSSSLATSELIERVKRLLDSEKKEVDGKGLVVPHNIRLKMEWDKFSTDSEEAIMALENEILAAAADHINDSLYYTYAPLNVEVKPDYFIKGVKLFVGFDEFADDTPEIEMNVTVDGIRIDLETDEQEAEPEEPSDQQARYVYQIKFLQKGFERERVLVFAPGKRISVGRTKKNDLVIDDDGVSKYHASLVADDQGRLSLADTGSTNGTFINNERIAYGKAMRLEASDKLRFGSVDVSIERLDSTASDGNPSAESSGSIDPTPATAETHDHLEPSTE